VSKRRRIALPRASSAPEEEAQFRAAAGGQEEVEMQQQHEEHQQQSEEEENEEEEEEEDEEVVVVLEEGHVQGANYEESQFGEEDDYDDYPSGLFEIFGGLFGEEENTAGDDNPGIDDI
jgi:hypothetical protein